MQRLAKSTFESWCADMGRVTISGFESEYKFTRRVMEMKDRGYKLVDMGSNLVPMHMDTYNYGGTKILREGKGSKKHWAVMERVKDRSEI